MITEQTLEVVQQLPPIRRVLRDVGVAEKLGISARMVYKLAQQDASFPKSFKLSGTTVAVWDEQEVDVWLEASKHAYRSQQ